MTEPFPTETERLEAKQSSASRTVPNSNGEKPMLEHFEDLLNLSTDCPCDDWSSIGEYLRGF